MIPSLRFRVPSPSPWQLAFALIVLPLIVGSLVVPSMERRELSTRQASPLISQVSHANGSGSNWASWSDRALQDDENDGDDAATFSAQDLEFFETKVRPLLVEHCYECHGPDSDFEGGLSLATRADLMLGGDTGELIDTTDPAASLLIDVINWGDVYQMPPESKLADEEIAILTEWVERGAPWTPSETESVAERMGAFNLAERKAEHWCWQPIANPELPHVKDESWPRENLDRFILAKLESAGLSPNEPADKATWLRRVHFDLTGLPPTVEELERFLNDDSPHAYEKVVDELLASKHFGERWARHWMDLVRYAETCGHEFDYPIPNAWRYRDYLIRAFNTDVPYDDLIREHLAGDLLEQPRVHPHKKFNESVIATGFWFLGEATHAPVDVKGDEAGRVDNQIDVMSKTFLGLTVACARCHDHKFDAISTKDYYALAGFLQSSRRAEATLDPDQRIHASLERLRQKRTELAELLATRASQSFLADADQVESFLRRVVGLPTSEDKPNDLEEIKRWRDALSDESVNRPSHPAFALHQLMRGGDSLESKDSAVGEMLAALTAHADAFEKSGSDSIVFHDFVKEGTEGWYLSGNAFATTTCDWESLASPAPDNQVQLSVGSLSSGQLSNRLFGVARSPTFVITHPRIHYRMAGEQVTIRLIIDGYTMDVYNGLLFGDVSKKNVQTEGQVKWVQQAGDIGRYQGHRAHIEIIDHGDGFSAIEQIRFSNGNPPIDPPAKTLDAFQPGEGSNAEALIQHLAEAIATFGREQHAAEPHRDLVAWLVRKELLSTPAANDPNLAELHEQIKEIAGSIPHPVLVQAMTDGDGENEFVFVRGNHRVLGDEAVRQPPEALTRDWESVNKGSGRLQLANKIASAENPLTTRVIANRIWHHLFGRGIVASVDNFGVLGQAPTHPELLDHLASEFATTHHWSIKSLIKQIVLSQTYRMSSKPQEAGTAVDPNNDLLHRMRIRRLQGETIRDSMLAVAGHLDRKMYGPSVPVHLTPFMQGRGRPGRSGPLDGNRRRSVYLEIRRNFLSPMMLAFDTPIPFNAMGRRNVSNVPAQALILMNDPFVHAEANAWAKRVMAEEPAEPRDRIQLMYRQAFARPATASEIERAWTFLETQAETMGVAESGIAGHEQLWTDLAHVLFNVKEYIYVN